MFKIKKYKKGFNYGTVEFAIPFKKLLNQLIIESNISKVEVFDSNDCIMDSPKVTINENFKVNYE